MSFLLIKKIQALFSISNVIISKQNEAQVELLKGEIDTLPKAKEYGFESFAPSGGHAWVFSPSGDKAQGVIIRIESKGSPKLEQGEVCLWNQQGAQVTLKADGSLELLGDMKLQGDLSVQGNIHATGEIKTQGDIKSQGAIHSNKDVTAGSVSLTNHTHSFTNADGAPSQTHPPQ